MKFSVLLPTRNRLDYLRFAVETVLRQDYDNWEIIVSDNSSEEDIGGYIASLSDPRVQYFRSNVFLPVTENWNLALMQSSGDYVVMLGDDDGLLPKYFSNLLQVLRRFEDPDFIYTGSLFFAYPGVMPHEPKGFLRPNLSRFSRYKAPFWLTRSRARDIAHGYLNFRMPIASNMQHSIVSRRVVRAMLERGPFFQSPYPDFFATPALFLSSTRILIVPKSMVVVGITPKSYGYYHFNDLTPEGVKFLQSDGGGADDTIAQNNRLPGTSYNDCWLSAMEKLADAYGKRYGLRVNYSRYRLLQIGHCYKRRFLDGVRSGGPSLSLLHSRMSLFERVAYGPLFWVGFSLLRIAPTGIRAWLVTQLRGLFGQHPLGGSSIKQDYNNMLEVFEGAEANTICRS